MLRGIDDLEVEMEAGGSKIFAMHCENFATIAKISQSLQKFLYAQFFAKLAKFRYHSESYCV